MIKMYWLFSTIFILVLVVVLYQVFQRKDIVEETPDITLPTVVSSPPAPVNEAEETLKQFYTPARPTIDLDYPPKKIGCCPFSKPVSTDLPIGNIPMCYASIAKDHLK
jgi:hypothetical protein